MPDRPVPYALTAGALIYLPPLLLMLAFGGLTFAPPTQPWVLHPLLMVMQALLLAPVIETIAMMPMMAVAQRFLRSENLVVIVCAGLWAAGHEVLKPGQGLFALWAFLVLGYVYLHWQKLRPHSFLWIVMIAHGVTNLPMAASVVYFGYFYSGQ